ncbi:MAG: HoxN/HupN/NixA family nickel/cobalt transporter, partial [Patescibacteria group bacterium]|nr:HoxN/HupN/NixA family nickel/cobalt transporter [Patescibacteria group bacterium]
GHIHNQGGMLTKAFKPVLSTISQSWHMYPVGFLFGLGFDTASEIALLSISATTGASGLPIWTVILLPLAFTAGMALIDSLDGLLMLGAYGYAFVTPIRKLTYNIWITAISVVVAFGIGTVEIFQILLPRLHVHLSFFSGISTLNLGAVGLGIIFIFALIWILAMAKNNRYFQLR